MCKNYKTCININVPTGYAAFPRSLQCGWILAYREPHFYLYQKYSFSGKKDNIFKLSYT
jgi:hypothetical protein